MEQPDVMHALELWPREGPALDPMEVSYFLSREQIVPGSAEGGTRRWHDRFFGVLARNAASVTDFFNIPTNRVVEIGSRVEI
jgi:KUP system potassium uptake protein